MAGEWVRLVLGVWVLLSPWILGLNQISVIMWSNLAVGVALILMSLWRIFGETRAR